MLSRYPEERELHERVRLYLNVCERHMAPRAASPSTPEERVFAATLAINAGNYDEALEHLRAASSESPEHDHALYMLASVLALRDEVDEAVPLLLRAIELNPDNRSLRPPRPRSRALREFDSVRTALEATSRAKAERRKAPPPALIVTSVLQALTLNGKLLADVRSPRRHPGRRQGHAHEIRAAESAASASPASR